MAKSKLIARTRRSIAKNEEMLREDRMADYRFARSQEDAIFNALTRSLRRTKRNISAVNARVLERMAALIARQRASRRVVRKLQEGAVERYGGMLAGEAKSAFAGARTVTRTGTEVARAAERAEERAAHAATNIVKVAQAGAEQARAGADYALAQALAQRGQADANLIAQQQHDLIMMKLQQQFAMAMAEKQAQLDFKYWKKQQEFLQSGGMGKDGQLASLVAEDLASLAPDIRRILAENPNMSASEVLQELGSNVTPDQAPYVLRVIQTFKNRGLYGGPSPSGTYKEGIDAIVDSMVALNPEWNKPKLRAALEKFVEAQLRLTYNRRAAAAREDEEQDQVTASPTPAPTHTPSAGPYIVRP